MAKGSNKLFIRRILWAIVAIVITGLIYGVFYINSLLPIITGYPAKYLCSAVFISGRAQTEVEAMDLHFSFIKYVENSVDLQDSSVTSTFLWGKSKAIFREGFGCTLLRGIDENELRKIKFPKISPAYHQDTLNWPLGNRMLKHSGTVDSVKLSAIEIKLMTDKAYNGNAFAFMVIHKGIPVLESYRAPFNASTRFLSWSMAKSFTNALAGIMVKQGKWDISQAIPLTEWQDDDRKQITINNLLQMQSGLQWNEDYGNRSDVTMMLYCENDFARFAFEKPLQNPVGSKWYYSSGTTNIVNYLIRKSLNNDKDYYRFAYQYLFNKIGMPDAVFEVDAAGNQVGSSYIYATARDYARFGLLYLQDGVFGGERILPEGWVNYTTTSASDSKGEYGLFFWLNKGKYYPSAPDDMYSCNGHDGQRIFIIPSKELVVVLLGYSPKPDHAMNFDALLSDVLKVVEIK